MPAGIYDPLSGAVQPFATVADAWAAEASIAGIPSYTWATKPLAAAYTGLAILTDVGPAGSLWRSNGTLWVPVNDTVLLARSAVAQTAITGVTTEQNAAPAIVIPAGLIGANGGLRVAARFGMASSADDKTLRLKLGATAFETLVLTTSVSVEFDARIDNRNDEAVQIGGNAASPMIGTATAFVTGTIDTTAAQNLLLTGQLEAGGDSIQLLSYEVWLKR